jgi:hypothetical protein
MIPFRPTSPRRGRSALTRLGRAVLLGFGSIVWSESAAASWPPRPQNDGVYGRLDGDTDLSLKLGGQLGQGGWAGSVGLSAHYYSILGITADYCDSLDTESRYARSFSAGPELRPLFLPRFALGLERGPAWLDLALDSVSLGFGAYYSEARGGGRDTQGVWFSAGLGLPLFGHAAGPWLEARALRRLPDPGPVGSDGHDALFMYLSWHHWVQLGPLASR